MQLNWRRSAICSIKRHAAKATGLAAYGWRRSGGKAACGAGGAKK